MSLDDPEVVRAEYASEDGLVARASVYQGVAGPYAREVVFAAVEEACPHDVLEVGCGWGELAARIRDEVTGNIVVVDISPRMVELARARGVDAHVGDVCALPFGDASFDCVTANWMLYHAPDIDLALSELARVLRHGGTLVAATNSTQHLEELWHLVGRDKATESRHFFSEDGVDLLARHFDRVERRDVVSRMAFDTEAARGYVSSSIAHKHLAARVPELAEPLVVTRRCTVFVAGRS
jgi:ubiquinone/menaquinone biosynthesis C-methylase UbiE